MIHLPNFPSFLPYNRVSVNGSQTRDLILPLPLQLALSVHVTQFSLTECELSGTGSFCVTHLEGNCYLSLLLFLYFQVLAHKCAVTQVWSHLWGQPPQAFCAMNSLGSLLKPMDFTWIIFKIMHKVKYRRLQKKPIVLKCGCQSNLKTHTPTNLWYSKNVLLY